MRLGLLRVLTNHPHLLRSDPREGLANVFTTKGITLGFKEPTNDPNEKPVARQKHEADSGVEESPLVAPDLLRVPGKSESQQ